MEITPENIIPEICRVQDAVYLDGKGRPRKFDQEWISSEYATRLICALAKYVNKGCPLTVSQEKKWMMRHTKSTGGGK